MPNVFGQTTPFSQYIDPRRNALMGAAAGLGSTGGVGDMWRGAMQGMALDQQYAQNQMDLEQQQAEQNKTMAWLQSAYPEYATLPVEQGFQLAMKAEAEKTQGFGASAPANVQEWQYYSSLSPEDQSRYLTMKRSNTPLNIGTGFVTQDPANPGSLLGEQIPIDNFTPAQDAALGKVIGDAAAQKIINLPQTLATADNMIGSIDGILNDPALDVSTGWLAWMQGVPGTEQYRFGQRALQLQGQAFLQAFESLKGGGQITQVEGEKATQAIGRLSTAQNPADYRQALSELRAIIETAKQRAQQGAANVQVPGNSALGGSGSMPSASGKVRVFNPATGRLE